MVCEWQPPEATLVRRASHIPDSLFTNDINMTEDTEVEGDSESELEVETIDGLVANSDGKAWNEYSNTDEEDGNFCRRQQLISYIEFKMCLTEWLTSACGHSYGL